MNILTLVDIYSQLMKFKDFFHDGIKKNPVKHRAINSSELCLSTQFVDFQPLI